MVTAGFLLAACRGLTVEPDASSPATLPPDALALPEVGFPGYQQMIEELRGTPVVVNIWGSWCAPCRAEAPHLARVAKEFDGRVQFLGVDILDDREAARRFIREFGWDYPQIFDPDAEIRDGLGFPGQPITLIYNSAGNITFRWVGAVTEDLLREEIREVL